MKRFYVILTLLALVLFSFNVNGQNNRANVEVAGPGSSSCSMYDVELIVTDISWNMSGYHHVHLDFNKSVEFNYDNTSQPYTCDISSITLYGVADLPVRFFYETSPNDRVQAVTNAQGELTGFRVFPFNPNVGGVTTTALVTGMPGWIYDGTSTCVGVSSSNRSGYNCSLPNQTHYYCGGSNGTHWRVAQATDQQIHTYPNPAQDRLFVETSALDVVQINVMSLYGQILNDKVSVRNGIDKAQINTSQLESGIYLIAIETPNGTIVEKVMIQGK